MKVLTWIYNVAKFVSMWSVIALSLFILANAAIIEIDWMDEYRTELARVEREHERQKTVSLSIQSQKAWMRTNDATTRAFLDARADKNSYKRLLMLYQKETWAFMKVLDKDYPGVREEIFDKIGAPKVPTIDPTEGVLENPPYIEGVENDSETRIPTASKDLSTN